jgi:hypothetical protein
MAATLRLRSGQALSVSATGALVGSYGLQALINNTNPVFGVIEWLLILF